MWSFRRKAGLGGTAVAEEPRPAGEFHGDDAQLLAEIERLSEGNRSRPSRETERRLVELRHLAGIRILDAPRAEPRHPEPDFTALPEVTGLPDVPAADVTPELLRAGILRDGCLLVRGLVPREDALHLAGQIDRAFAERERWLAGERPAEGYYEELAPHPRFHPELSRSWIREGGGVLASDSPMLSFEMTEMFRRAGVQRLVEAYLGEPALGSLQKTTLRKAEPEVGGAWHQDGSFMGPVRSLNLWLSLSRCGDISPGLDVVPRRLEEFVTRGTDEAVFDIQVSQRHAELAAGDRPILRPIFEPGDALLFDELFLHQTGSDPSMPNPRFAVEHWFFGPSAFPTAYAPILV